jgi:hypothetical protein
VAGRSPILFVLLTVLIDTIGFGIIMPVLPELIMQIASVPLPDAARIGGCLRKRSAPRVLSARKVSTEPPICRSREQHDDAKLGFTLRPRVGSRTCVRCSSGYLGRIPAPYERWHSLA